MAAAAIDITGVIKRYQGLRPLRVARLVVNKGDALAIAGMDSAAAEVFVNLITGASVPDEGDVRVEGRNTRDISTDTEWLASLDRFGIVTERAVLLESLSVASNLALPFTLAIDPMSPDVRARVEALSDEVGLTRAQLDGPVSRLTPPERLRLHLGRALGPGPEVLLLEHPTAALEPPAAREFGAALASVASARGLGWVALTMDDDFAKAAGARRLRLDPGTGSLGAPSLWRKLLS